MDKVAWITGASTGIGFEITKVLSKNGFIVVATGRRKSRLVHLINEIKFAGREGSAFVCNVQSERSVLSTKKKILERYGSIDVLVNNAGVTVFKSFIDTKTSDYDNIIDTNVRGTFLTTKSVLKQMTKQRSGHIVNILSVAANSVFTESSVYSASKAAVQAMSRVLREEVRRYNIKITNIIPGATDTPMWENKFRQKYKNRMMTPREVADIAASVLLQPKKVVIEEVMIRPIKGDI